MKRIALYIISDGIGGAEQVVWKIIEQLKDRLQLYLIVNNEIASYYAELLSPENIYNLGNIYLHHNPKYKLFRYFFNNRYFNLKGLLLISKTKKLNTYLQSNKIDKIHAHLEFALFSILRIKSINKDLRIIYTVHSEFGFLKDKTLKPQIKITTSQFSKVDNFVFVSEYISNVYKKNNVPINNYQIIYNALPANSFEGLNKSKVVPSVFTVLYVGGAKFVKGYDILVNTIVLLVNKYKISNIQIIVLGEVPDNSKFKKLALESGLISKMKFKGFIKPPFHLNYFNQSSILFMPSRTEAMPMAAIEALLSGLPIIASNVGGFPEIIENGKNGFLCEFLPEDFSAKIYSVYCNYPAFLTETKTYNSSLMEKFDIKPFDKKHFDLYR